MDRLAVRVVLIMLAVLALSQACAGCSAKAEPPAVAIEAQPEQALSYGSAVVQPLAITVAPARASLELPDTCDPLLVVDSPTGPRLSKQLPAWFRSESGRAAQRAETRRIIEAVVAELGADANTAELLYRKAIVESSANPGAVHILNPDIQANRTWARHGRKRSSERWAKARVPVHAKTSGGSLEQTDDVDAWALGRGLYGMVTGLYMHRWSTDAPPWSLCDPAVATVVAIWSGRAGQKRCKSTTMRSAYRWLSAGACKPRAPEKERRFDRLARGNVRGLRLPRIDSEADVDFGERWPEATADRAELLAVIRQRLAQSQVTGGRTRPPNGAGHRPSRL